MQAVSSEKCKNSAVVVLVTAGNTTAQSLSVGLCKMASFTLQEKVHCCYWLAESKFPMIVQHKFCHNYSSDAPYRHTLVNSHQHLLQHGNLSDAVQAGDGGQHLNKSKPFGKLSNEVCRSPFGEEAVNAEFLIQWSMM
jgi:hypothetical protein